MTPIEIMLAIIVVVIVLIALPAVLEAVLAVLIIAVLVACFIFFGGIAAIVFVVALIGLAISRPFVWLYRRIKNGK